MEAWLHSFFADLHWTLLGLSIVVCLYVLGKAADLLVDEAVDLSERSKIPKTIIGATVVSLGTTAPEAAVSVLAAIEGLPLSTRREPRMPVRRPIETVHTRKRGLPSTPWSFYILSHGPQSKVQNSTDQSRKNKKYLNCIF